MIPLVERMDYLGPQSNSLAYVLSVEKLLGIEVPERVKWIRVLIAELQRITSHLVWLGTHALDLGAVSVLMYCFRERELLLNINEMLAGFRMFPSYMRIGGLREDLPRGFHDAVNAFLDAFPAKMRRVRAAADQERRSSGAAPTASAYLSKEDTLASGWSGPMARAAGDRLRRAQGVPLPAVQTRSTFDVPTQPAGDVYARYLVRDRGDAGERRRSAGRRSSASRRPASGPSTTRGSRRRRRTRSTRRWKR